MAQTKKKRSYAGDARELLKIGDAIYDQGFDDGYGEAAKAKAGADGAELARACGWSGAKIATAFCRALTDANFHKERTALAPAINRLFRTRIRKEG